MLGRSRARRALMLGGTAAIALPTIGLPAMAYAQAKPRVRIGLPTKTYFPTIIAETALRQKLFEKEGVQAELTIYRSGAEGFEALAAGAADLIYNSSSSVAAGLVKGVKSRCVANGGLNACYYTSPVAPGQFDNLQSELTFNNVPANPVIPTSDGLPPAACGHSGAWSVTFTHVVQELTNQTLTVSPF